VEYGKNRLVVMGGPRTPSGAALKRGSFAWKGSTAARKAGLGEGVGVTPGIEHSSSLCEGGRTCAKAGGGKPLSGKGQLFHLHSRSREIQGLCLKTPRGNDGKRGVPRSAPEEKGRGRKI